MRYLDPGSRIPKYIEILHWDDILNTAPMKNNSEVFFEILDIPIMSSFQDFLDILVRSYRTPIGKVKNFGEIFLKNFKLN